MSMRYKGGVISATPPTVSTASAKGLWTLEQQLQYQAAGVWPAQPIPQYIEDVFSTWLYTGTGATQTITNGIDLSGKGGLVWIKGRSGATNHILNDTARGLGPDSKGNELSTNLDSAAFIPSAAQTASVTSFLSNGFTIGDGSRVNLSSATYVSWTFRKQAKFFDVVTYTGTGSARTVAHNLGSVPGCMIIKCTSTTSAWFVYHRSLDPGGNPATAYLALNTTAAVDSTLAFTNTQPTSSVFYVGDGVGQNPINQNGATYVAYLFAHNAGGFGLTGTDNVISCGSYTGNATAGNTITLGYEPQWIMIKQAAGTDAGTNSWSIYDNMRGMPNGSANDNRLEANNANAEVGFPEIAPTATGFVCEATGGRLNASGGTYIYIAIRRGPMKVPTSGTSVFNPTAFNGNGSSGSYSNTFPTDMIWHQTRNTAGLNHFDYDKLRGINLRLLLNDTGAEGSASFYTINTSQNLVSYSGNSSGFNASGETYIDYSFRRAPGFFDEVCYTGNSTARTVNHNLGVAPELLIVKTRSVGGTNRGWWTYVAPLGNTQALYLNGQDNAQTAGIWNNTTPTSTVFSVDGSYLVNESGTTYVAYLFATCAGVSKVGSYTGTGTIQTINCGFTGGARFVLIKRTDSTGDWYVWDSARGIVAGNDPYLLLNSTAAEVTNTDYVDTFAAGFEISSTAPAAINANGGSYIFWAVA
jgi:hypothetical protein